MIRFTTFFITLLFILPLHAQEGKRSLEFSPQLSLATFSANNNKMSGSAIGGELIYHIYTENSSRPWIRTLHISSIDILFNYKNMKGVKLVNSPIEVGFGDSYALMGAISLPVVKRGGTALLFSSGVGLAYAGETWFTNENPIIGSHLNFALSTSLKINSPITRSTKLSAGIDLFHYSNAGVRVPNNGINMSNLSVGLIQYLSVQDAKPEVPIASYFESRYKKHSVDLAVNMGRRGVYHSKNGLYKTGLYAGYNYRINTVLGLSTGIDAVYYHSVFDPNREAETFQSYATSFQRWRVGLGLGPDLWMGRIGFMLKYGYYLHYESLMPVNTYWTAGMKYYILNWAALQAKTYIHKAQVDFIGFGFVITP